MHKGAFISEIKRGSVSTRENSTFRSNLLFFMLVSRFFICGRFFLEIG